jgi:hypothetical protein
MKILFKFLISAFNFFPDFEVPENYALQKEYSGFGSIAIVSNVTPAIDDTFKGCSNLQYVDFQSANEFIIISKNMFSSTLHLKHVTLPPNLLYIEDYAFF